MRYPFNGTYQITQPFGRENAAITGGKHTGTDWALPMRTPVLAITGGQVVNLGVSKSGAVFISILSGDLRHVYYHLDATSRNMNDRVKEGDQVGVSGNTGLSTGPHLHLETKIKGVLTDPVKVINNGGFITAPPVLSTDHLEYRIIQKGDTFWDLDQKLGLNPGTLQSLNPELDPKQLQIGGQIRIRQATQSATPSLRRLYVIKRNETFWGLENALQLPHGRLQELNPGLNPRTLQIGQKIIIG